MRYNRHLMIGFDSNKSASSAWKAAVAVALILIPLFLTIAVKYRSAAEQAAATSSIASVVAAPAKVEGASEPYLSDAVAGTLSAYLYGVPGLDTRIPPSSADFERIGSDYNALAKAYGVSALILTAITTDGALYMINVEIADTRSRKVLWANRYQGTRAQYIPLIRAAGEGLRQALRPRTSRLSFNGGVSSNSEAELTFREGEYLRERGIFEESVSAFKRALEIDPALGDAAAEIALLHARAASGNASEIERWAGLALKIDSGSGRSWVALAEAERWRREPSAKRRLVNALRGASLETKYPAAHKVLAASLSEVPALFKPANAEWQRLTPLDVEPPVDAPGLRIGAEEGLLIIREALSRGEAPGYFANWNAIINIR